jgi:RNA polymerase sigma-70 factor (ECF subfamily)
MREENPVEESYAELFRRMAEQDRSALALFYDQAAPALYSFALRMLGNSQDAEEVIQDVFAQVWAKAQSFDPSIGEPFHWAIRIARNRCIDHLRARQRRSRHLVELEDGFADESPGPAPEPSALTSSELDEVRSAVAGLPNEQRQAIEMAFFGGLTHEEIAASLNEPLGTIKARIRRGMLRLRDNLRERLV